MYTVRQSSYISKYILVTIKVFFAIFTKYTFSAVSINPTVLSESPGAAKRVNNHNQNQLHNQHHNQNHNHNQSHKNHQKPVAGSHRTAPSPPGFQTPVNHPAPSGFHGSYQIQQSQMPSTSRPPMPSSQNQASPQSTTGRTPKVGQASPQRSPMGGQGSPQRRPFVPMQPR